MTRFAPQPLAAGSCNCDNCRDTCTSCQTCTCANCTCPTCTHGD